MSAPTPRRFRTATRRLRAVGSRRLTAGALLALVVLTLSLVLVAPSMSASGTAADGRAEGLLRQALQQARGAGSYVIDVDLSQTITPEDPLGRQSKEEWAQFALRGEIGGPDQARFALSPRKASFATQGPPSQELLLVGNKVYTAEGDRWVASESAPAMLALDQNGLTLLDVAKDIHELEPEKGPAMLAGGQAGAADAPSGDAAGFRRVGFAISSADVLRHQLAKQGAVNGAQVAHAEQNSTAYVGTGELWIDRQGYPARMLMDLHWRQQDDVSQRVRVHSETDYSHFGQHFGAARFSPAARVAGGQLVPAAFFVPTGLGLVTLLYLAAMAFLFRRAWHGNRRALKVATALLVVGLLTPNFAIITRAAMPAAASGQGTADGQKPVKPGHKLGEVMQQARDFQLKMQDGQTPADSLVDGEDEDGDTLPNGYEVRYGTNPFAKDSDYDHLSDFEELNGITCEADGQTITVKTNPLMSDSNQDGLLDGRERVGDSCGRANNNRGWAWDDDNDGDGVPDGLDLSPQSASRLDAAQLGGPQHAGSNLTFETLDQDPATDVTTPYPFYVELQLRPRAAESMRWAYKTVDWPTDHRAAVRVNDPLMDHLMQTFFGSSKSASGEVKLVPMLQATVREEDLPTAKTMRAYGVSASLHKDGDSDQAYDQGHKLMDMLVPLMTVERGGQAFAFQAKMLHDKRHGNDNLLRHWQDVRLKWAVIADVLMPDEDGIPTASPGSGYGLWLYDEPYELTGLSVTRQGGASMLVAAALPSNQPYDDGPISLLRGGLEAGFLAGDMSLNDIKTRFNSPTNATTEQRWGIPQSTQFRVVHDSSMNYKHLDAAIATTTMTTTKAVLSAEFGSNSFLKPTLLYASEQRTSSVNLDEDAPQNYHDISINTCLQPLVTSRSLKLTTYDWVYGDSFLGHWQPMDIDQVLEQVEQVYAASTPAGDPFYEEHLLILKMAMTTWQMGTTSVYMLGQLIVPNVADMLTDPQILTALTTQDGSMPSEMKEVFDQLLKVWQSGGPVAWLQAKWATVVDVWNGLEEVFAGSYLDMANKTPDSYIKVIAPEPDPENGTPLPPPDEHMEDKLMSYTSTALTVLGYVAMVVDDELFNTVMGFLTRTIGIFQNLRSIVNTVATIVTISRHAQTFEAAVTSMTDQLGALARPMSLVGLVFTVAIIWIAVLIQLGDVGAAVGAAVVVRAIVETVLAVVLFVIALFFPYGTLIAIAIALVKLVEGIVGVNLDPISYLLDFLFTAESVERTGKLGDPVFGDLDIESKELGAGVVAYADFRLELPARASMQTINEGSGSDLDWSYTELHVGRFDDWPGQPNVCTPSMDLFNEYKAAVGSYFADEFHALNHHCVYFDLPNDKWNFSAGHVENRGNTVDAGSHYEREDQLYAYLDASPSAGVNNKLVLDVSLDMQIRYDQCTVATGCDQYVAKSTAPPSLTDLYFDILPANVEGLWNWAELRNYDPDGDGLVGYEYQGQTYGPDGNMCQGRPGNPIPSWNNWDSDGDGLSDKFELTDDMADMFDLASDGFDPCDSDTDDDGLKDSKEFAVGTFPDDKDTDNDGLTDLEEVPYDTGVGIHAPWTLYLSQDYPGMPDAVAYPNPRVRNIDFDHRGDKQEREKGSSPTSYNVIPLGEPLPMSIAQQFEPQGGQSFTLTSAAWENDEVAAVNPTLSITLPLTLANETKGAHLKPHTLASWLNFGTPLASPAPNVWRWSLPPIWQGRYLQAKLSGLPTDPTGPLTVTASLEYDAGGTHQVSQASAALLVNSGGPVLMPTGATGATVLDGPGKPPLAAASAGADWMTGTANGLLVYPATTDGLVTVFGLAEDPDRVATVMVCVKATDDCGGADWKVADLNHLTGAGGWSYNFAPDADGSYFLRAYGIDTWGLSGATTEPMVLGIDQAAPTEVSFDLGPTAFVSTTVQAGQPAGIALSGTVSESPGGYVSGVGRVSLLERNETTTAEVEKPGAASSRFHLTWTPPKAESVRTPSGDYELLLGGADAAGNPGAVTDTLRLVVDDRVPALHARLPQAITGPALTLSGLADDTARVHDRQAERPFGSLKSIGSARTQFTTANAMARAVVVGDVSGDEVDDVVLLQPATAGFVPVTFRAGLFFGRVGGLPGTLAMANADVILQGETPFTPGAVGASAAGVGDVNGDGVGDLLLGDPTVDGGKGRAYLVLGRRAGWTTPQNLAAAAWRLNVAGSLAFGGAVADAGDVNGDGLSDVLVGASQLGAQNGGAWLYLGRELGAPAAATTSFTPPLGTLAGVPNLAGLGGRGGDANGDGLADFLMAFRGAPVALVHGRTTDLWAANLALATGAAALLAGAGPQQTVAGPGDVNGDGLADLLIGDPDAADPRVYLSYGRRAETPWLLPPQALNLVTKADASWLGARGSRLGAGLAGFGPTVGADADGDGRADFAMGQPGTGTGPNRIAIVYSHTTRAGRDQAVETASQLFAGMNNPQRFGDYLSIGDVSADHVHDLLVGAPGENKAYLFVGDFAPGRVAGIRRVEVGLFGPVTDASQPVTATLPVVWKPALLAAPDGAISPWTATLGAPVSGDYRLYARSTDRAGNRMASDSWYVGNVWVSGNVGLMTGLLGQNQPLLKEQTHLRQDGTLGTGPNTRAFRVYDGFGWHRLAPVAGGWSQLSTIPRTDKRKLNLLAVARDALGKTAQMARPTTVDTLATVPPMASTLPVGKWQTDLSPTLVASWPAPVDGSGVSGLWASIDTAANTEPTTPVAGGQLSKALTVAGTYFAHLRVRDNAGNESTKHLGPFLVNRSQTPSVILADGRVDLAGGEYPEGTLLGYDPYAAHKPSALYGTWDTAKLYLGLPGHSWQAEAPLAIYLDSKAGGLTTALGPTAATLPFGADFALVVGQPKAGAFTLMSAANGAWVAVESPVSQAKVDLDTELVLDKAELGLTGALGLLALADDGDAVAADGIWAVLPAAARPDTAERLTGPLVLGQALTWPDLAKGRLPNLGLGQALRPEVTILPAWDNVLSSGHTATFQVVVHNPDVGRYTEVPLEIEVDPDLALMRLEGGSCRTCPQGGSHWTLLANVAAGGTQTMTLHTTALGETQTDVHELGLSAWLAGSGLPASPQMAAKAHFELDHGTTEVTMLSDRPEVYVRPGNYQLGFKTLPDRSRTLRCAATVEVNPGGTGSVYSAECAVGDCTVIDDTMPIGGSKVIRVRTTGSNGRSSTPVEQIVTADDTAPSVSIAATSVLTGTVPFIEGLAWDSFPANRAPVRVEVSLDGGAFRPALLAAVVPQGESTVLAVAGANEPAATPEEVRWRFPLWLSREDGQPVQVVARAIDEAGNVSRTSEMVTIQLDHVGPLLTASLDDGRLLGTVRDGAGVARLMVSLDGGTHYEPVDIRDGEWRYELADWPHESIGLAMFRAWDVHDNVSRQLLELDSRREPTESAPPPRLLPPGAVRDRVILPFVVR